MAKNLIVESREEIFLAIPESQSFEQTLKSSNII